MTVQKEKDIKQLEKIDTARRHDVLDTPEERR